MTFYRLIDRDSIRRNPSAGRQDYFMAGHSTAHLKICGKAKGKLIPPQVVVTFSSPDAVHLTWSPQNPECQNHEAILHALLPQFFKGASCELSFRQDILNLHSGRPEANFLFNWAPCTVRCDACDEAFDASKLEADSHDFADGGWSDKVCPNCGNWECCELEHEHMPDAELAKWADSNDTTKRDQEGRVADQPPEEYPGLLAPESSAANAGHSPSA